MKIKGNIKRILNLYTVILLYISVAGFLYNFCANGHFHTDENGFLVYHFHPTEKSESDESNPHHHSNLEFTTIHNYNHVNIFVAAGISIAVNSCDSIIEELSFRNQFYISKHLFSYKSLRAPPELS